MKQPKKKLYRVIIQCGSRHVTEFVFVTEVRNPIDKIIEFKDGDKTKLAVSIYNLVSYAEEP